VENNHEVGVNIDVGQNESVHGSPSEISDHEPEEWEYDEYYNCHEMKSNVETISQLHLSEIQNSVEDWHYLQ